MSFNILFLVIVTKVRNAKKEMKRQRTNEIEEGLDQMKKDGEAKKQMKKDRQGCVLIVCDLDSMKKYMKMN